MSSRNRIPVTNPARLFPSKKDRCGQFRPYTRPPFQLCPGFHSSGRAPAPIPADLHLEGPPCPRAEQATSRGRLERLAGQPRQVPSLGQFMERIPIAPDDVLRFGHLQLGTFSSIIAFHFRNHLCNNKSEESATSMPMKRAGSAASRLCEVPQNNDLAHLNLIGEQAKQTQLRDPAKQEPHTRSPSHSRAAESYGCRPRKERARH